MTVGSAAAFARQQHAGQLDKAGQPYYDAHVADVHRRVVAAGGDEEQQIAALLHDVLEDTPVTEAELRAHGCPEGALRIVQLLTKTQDRDRYLARIRDHEAARQVKLADIASNTDPGRLARVPEATRLRLLTKYAGYLDALGEDASHLPEP